MKKIIQVLSMLPLMLLMIFSGSGVRGAHAQENPVKPPSGDGGSDASAGNPDLDFAQVVFVRADRSSGGAWCFDTTVRHNDEGWDHYADAWQVVTPEGTVLAERILTHPHDDEQPFTRDKCAIGIPRGVDAVVVRAKCTVHGFGGKEVLVDLTAAEGENFKVTR